MLVAGSGLLGRPVRRLPGAGGRQGRHRRADRRDRGRHRRGHRGRPRRHAGAVGRGSCSASSPSASSCRRSSRRGRTSRPVTSSWPPTRWMARRRPVRRRPPSPTPPSSRRRAPRAGGPLLGPGRASIFGVGLVASGKAAILVPPIWVALSARLIGLVVVALPLVLQRRLTLTRAALPLVDPVRDRRDPRLDPVGLGRHRQHRGRRRPGLAVRRDRRRHGLLPVRRAAVTQPAHRRRADHRRGDGPGGDQPLTRHRPGGCTRYTPAS